MLIDDTGAKSLNALAESLDGYCSVGDRRWLEETNDAILEFFLFFIVNRAALFSFALLSHHAALSKSLIKPKQSKTE